MSDEASQILEMVADGKITVDEAAKLLEALSGQGMGGKMREMRISKTMGGPGPEMLHGHMHGCHCVSLSGTQDINIWREHSDDV